VPTVRARALIARSDCSKELEFPVLRHELSILRRQSRRPRITPRDRLVLAALSLWVPETRTQGFASRTADG
jgi:hypothetical protein